MPATGFVVINCDADIFMLGVSCIIISSRMRWTDIPCIFFVANATFPLFIPLMHFCHYLSHYFFINKKMFLSQSSEKGFLAVLRKLNQNLAFPFCLSNSIHHDSYKKTWMGTHKCSISVSGSVSIPPSLALLVWIYHGALGSVLFCVRV